MIIGDTPTYTEQEKGTYFVDSAARFLLNELSGIGGIDIEDCYFTKAIKCYHGTGTTVSVGTIKNCREILEREIAEVKPAYILLLGVTALRTLLGHTNLTTHRGKLYDYKGIKVVATVNPSIVLRQPNAMWEFRSDLEYFVRVTEGAKPLTDFKWESIQSQADLDRMREDISKSDAIAYDIETSMLEPYTPKSKIHIISIATRKQVWVMRITEAVVKVLQEVLGEGNSYAIIAHNSKFDNKWLRTVGVNVNTTYDTYLAAYLANGSIPHGLKYLAKTYLGADSYDQGIVFEEELTEAEYDNLAKYCALDSYYTLKLYDLTREWLDTDGYLWNVFKYIVMPGEKILQEIEERGVYVDQSKLAKAIEYYNQQKDDTDKQIEKLLPPKWQGGAINLNSSKQQGELLFEDLRLPCREITPTGAYATGKSVLLRLVGLHPIPELLLNRRKYDKALSGFLTPWGDFLKRDGRLHSTYNIAKTATGRLSAENPNLQQVPRDPMVRGLVGVPEGKVFIEADYSQLELRVAACVANAESMKRCYRCGEDLHTKTAAAIAHTALDKVTKAQRTAAKAVNFGYLYGMWWRAFKSYAFESYGVVVTDKEAEESRITYFNTYPELSHWHKRQVDFVHKYKYVRTLTGRIRHLPNIDSPDTDLKGSAERQAINTVVQSFGSDITMLAMILIDKNIKLLFKDKAHIVGQIHDSILVEADEDIGEQVAHLVKKCMESVPVVLQKYFKVFLDIPIIAEVEIGKAWGEGKPLK